MRHYFVLGGKMSSDFGCYVASSNMFDAPERDIEVIEVAGRNGELVFDNGRYRNFEGSVSCYIPKDMQVNVDGIRSWLLSTSGYLRYEDTLHPDEFRIARYSGSFELDASDRVAATFPLKFNCKPQRFLKSGEKTYTFTANGEIRNNTLFPAKPRILIYGNGTAGIGQKTIEVKGNTYPYVEVDCETMDAFYGATNCNSMISLTSGDFPVLNPGDNGITLGKGITKIELIPRWWIV